MIPQKLKAILITSAECPYARLTTDASLFLTVQSNLVDQSVKEKFQLNWKQYLLTVRGKKTRRKRETINKSDKWLRLQQLEDLAVHTIISLLLAGEAPSFY